MMWHSLAIAAAVTGWSPVTIITLMPAAWHFRTAKGTVSLGGSVKDRIPTKHCYLNGKLGLSTLKSNPFGNWVTGRWSLANPKTLSPFFPNLSFASLNLWFQV